jgi:hypothetical protein
MNLIVSIPVSFVIVTTSSLSYLSSVNNDKDKGFCYDHVGDGHDGHFCFGKEHICQKPLIYDDIAESPCCKDN